MYKIMKKYSKYYFFANEFHAKCVKHESQIKLGDFNH